MDTRVFKSFPISLSNRITWVDLVELCMVDLDGILGIDWLHDFFPSINFRTRVVNLCFSNEAILELKCGNSIRTGRIISCLEIVKLSLNVVFTIF